MSLVNEMLRDLDARRPQASAHHEHLPGSLSRQSSVSAWRWSLIGFTLVLAMAAMLYGYLKHSSVVSVTPPLSQQLADTRLHTSSHSSSAVAGSAPSPNPELEQNLRLANAALAAGQLTIPLDASAYWYYQQALQIDPENSQARAGITQIAEHYFAQAQRAQAADESPQALVLVNRALAINPNNSNAQAMLAQLQAPADLPATKNHNTVAQSRVDTSPLAAPEPTDPEAPATVVADAASSAGATDVAAKTAEPSMGVSVSWATRDQHTRRDAERLIARSQPERARLLLNNFLTRANEATFAAPLTRRYLQTLLLQDAELAAAEALITPELELADKSYLQARLYEHKGELKNALQTLEQGYAKAQSDEAYRALAASLYQVTGNHSAAENHYRRLLEVFGPRARYWLGLALALDRQQRYQLASVAYRRARDADDSTPAIVNFVDRRLIQIRM